MTHRLLGLAFLWFAVGAIFRFGWFTCCSVFMTPAADVLEMRDRFKTSHTLMLSFYCGYSNIKMTIKSFVFLT